jgi:hypothetical protein
VGGGGGGRGEGGRSQQVNKRSLCHVIDQVMVAFGGTGGREGGG